MQNAFRRNPVLRDYGAFPCPKMGLENEHVVLGGACAQYRSGVGIVGKSIDGAVGIIQAVDRTRQIQHTSVACTTGGPRYWLCETFEGHFFGIHMHGAQYYARTGGKIYDGYLAGGGVTYGHAWILSPRWNLEAVIGVGYARLWYKKRPDLPCAKCSVDKTRNYFGPTKISLSVSYLF
mgnify:FL=1